MLSKRVTNVLVNSVKKTSSLSCSLSCLTRTTRQSVQLLTTHDDKNHLISSLTMRCFSSENKMDSNLSQILSEVMLMYMMIVKMFVYVNY